jgi:tetratricopeptide (TPR) repeat protein/tRNA A-37 threonylcarbamoyl transferase component Bud32
MSAPVASDHLLFGLLALQNGLINQGQLVAAFQAWTLDKRRPLAEHLVARGDFDADGRAAVDVMVALHLKKNGDAQQSLAAVPAGKSTREKLAALGDPDLAGTLGHVASGHGSTADGRIDQTASYAVGNATSDGQRFRVLRPHAQGGLGAVFVALDAELNREVALKQILDHHADDPVSRQRFLIEAEITGGLEHPGIVPVYGLGAYGDGRPYYAMRFIKGDSLKEAIQRFHGDTALRARPGQRSLEIRRLLRRFMDVCNAIDYAHSRGVLHRDIKPGNVIVGKHGETLVVDWGLAKPLGRVEPGNDTDERTLMPTSASGSAETLPGSALGTPAYMSPEQACGDLDRLGPQSDVYSLGATLYCVLIGRPPFEAKDVGDLLRSVQRGEFAPPRQVDRSIDPALEAVCLKAMAKQQSDRYPSCRALAEDVERWIADEPVSARRDPILARLARWARRHRTAVAALGLSLATAVVLLGVSNVLVRKAERATARAFVRVKEEQSRTAQALERADANFRHARQAVEDYFTTISEDVLLDEPGMQSLREKLLRTALKYHEEFLKERAGDAAVEAELAESHRRYAKIADMTNRREDALRHVRIALDRFQELARDRPERPEYRRKQAESLSELAILLSSQKNQREDSIRASRAAITIFEELAHQHPKDEDVREGHATALAALGHTRSMQRGGGEEANQCLTKALELQKLLIADHPETFRYRRRLAELHGALYNSYVGSRARQTEALEASLDAMRVFEGLVKQFPHSPRFKTRLGVIHGSRSVIFQRMGKLDEAIHETEESRRLFLEVVRINPDIDEYRLNLARSGLALGLAKNKSDAHREALIPLRESCESFERIMAAHKDDTDVRKEYIIALNCLAVAVGSLGDDAEAVVVLSRSAELSRELIRQDPTNVFVRGGLMTTRINLGIGLAATGRHEEAVRAFEESRSIAHDIFGSDDWAHLESDAELAQIHIQMAYSLREVGRVEEAKEQVEKAKRKIGSSPTSLVCLARYESRGATLLAESAGDASAVAALENRAMDALRRVARYDRSQIRTLRTAEDLNPLRRRSDFQLLLLDVAFPANPFGP